MNTTKELIKELKKYPNMPAFIASSTKSSSPENLEVKIFKKFKLTEACLTLEDGLSEVAVICDKDFIPEYDDESEEQFREEMNELETHYNKD